MGKHDFLTPKAIANRIKAKGLQKLRWYCQMCRKQCRDENGFKCHCMSESHQRQMQVFGDNPERFVDGYTDLFEKSFLEHVKRSHRFSRVAATVVYNEYIADRHHVHMNSTEWATLTEFVRHLGRTGQCKVDQTEKGWFITYIDREPETLLKESLKNKRERAEVAEEERHERAIEGQIERAAKSAKLSGTMDDLISEDKQALKRTGDDEKVVFSLGSGRSKVVRDVSEPISRGGQPALSSVFGDKDKRKREHDSTTYRSAGSSSRQSENGRAGGTVLAQLMQEEEKVKEKVNRKDYWLVEGLVVKIMSKSLADQGFYKQKGVVEKVISKYVGQIKMFESGAILKVDQEELETVIPQIGGLVKIVNGAYRGSTAKLLSIDTENFTAKVQVEKGMYDGRVLDAVEYEDICKISL